MHTQMKQTHQWPQRLSSGLCWFIAIAFFFAFKERHWHKIKDAERKTRRRR